MIGRQNHLVSLLWCLWWVWSRTDTVVPLSPSWQMGYWSGFRVDGWMMGSAEDSEDDQEAWPVSPALIRGGHAALPSPRRVLTARRDVMDSWFVTL